MRLNELTCGLECLYITGSAECEITGIAYDSRKVQSGSLFVCLKGEETDGHLYIEDAKKVGAAAVIVEKGYVAGEDDITVVTVRDTREALASVSAKWFGNPAQKMTVIGITGTKGKTTTAHMIKAIIEASGQAVGMIGTLGAFIGNKKIPTVNTTPESYELHSLFDVMYKEGCKFVVMEVSSQALKQKRTAGICFDIGVFLNLSPDHIGKGEHADFTEYKEYKKSMFKQTLQAVINLDSQYSREFTELVDNPVTFSCRENSEQVDFQALNIEKMWSEEMLGSRFSLKGRLSGEFSVSMPGQYNAENALASIAVAALCKIPLSCMENALSNVSVKGRTQIIRETSHFATFIIDYAHNALSMESLLSMLKSYEPKRLVCLFGGGGNKPRQRRFDMGNVSGKYADLTVLTTDNPRFENVENINREIIEGLKVHNARYKVILDRREAIEYLIDTARKGDIVALIGKGHESYQEIQGKRYPFCEEQIILDYLDGK